MALHGVAAVTAGLTSAAVRTIPNPAWSCPATEVFQSHSLYLGQLALIKGSPPLAVLPQRSSLMAGEPGYHEMGCRSSESKSAVAAAELPGAEKTWWVICASISRDDEKPGRLCLRVRRRDRRADDRISNIMQLDR